ncbi:MAG: MotA/TolQ/ExbB proton channel family protein, partial [Bdellovibrionales bacterium]|nr:MotA/TolQ/ExbB proton channel family protein [Bdellovibrionales bacterium]
MNYLVGLGIATLSLFLAMDHLNQGADQFFDFVAFSIVWGGTLAVSVITLPWSQYRTLFSYFGKLLFHFGQKESHFVEHCLQRMSAHLQGDRGAVKGPDKFHHRILNEGFELIHLGFSSEKIEAILSERIHTFANQNESIANAIRSLAKYPPAFGLTGTVFGLVELMKGVSLGLSPQQTGYKMAIALVATLYGLLVSNLFI